MHRTPAGLPGTPPTGLGLTSLFKKSFAFHLFTQVKAVPNICCTGRDAWCNRSFILYLHMKKILLFSIYTFWAIAAIAQSDTATVNLKETIISASRTMESRKAVAQSVKVIQQAEMEQMNAQTTADLLQNTAGLFVQRSQQGGGSPVIRGFEASRVLMVVDGVRLNNAIYRSGHLQNILTMDNNTLERTEVLFGPSSTVYGSDALGGAICFYTKKPSFSAKKNAFLAKGNSFFRYGTVNTEKTTHADLSLGWHRIALLSSFTTSDFGNLRMGKKEGNSPFFGLREYYAERINGVDSVVRNTDPYLQKFSGYRQYDLLEKLVIRQNNNILHTLNVQYSNSTNIPRYDRLTETGAAPNILSYSDWYYGPQKRLMAAYQLEVIEAGWFNRGIQVTASWQDIQESRHSRRFGRAARRSQIEDVTVLGLTAMAEREKDTNRFRVGIDVQNSDVTSTAFEKNLSSGAETPFGTRYPDGGSTMTNIGVFTTLTQKTGQFVFNEGIRSGYSSLKAAFVNRDLFPFPFRELTQKSPVASGSLGVVWNTAKALAITASAASGFRMPNVDDSAKVFESAAGSLIVPNPDIKPEQTYNFELGWRLHLADRFRWETALWNTAFRNAIVTGNFQFNGQDSVEYDGELSRVLAMQNKRKATILGFTSSAEVDIISSLTFSASVTYTKGRIIEADGVKSPLDHIPPVYGRIALRYHQAKADVEIFTIFNGKKSIDDYLLNGEDNEQYAPADGMPSWYTINLRAGYRFNRFLQLQAGIDNIADVQYRNFASGINAPGRNIFGTLRVSF